MMYQFSSKTEISPELEERLTKLRQRLVGFQVVTTEGDTVGSVRDLVINPDNRLNLLVQRESSEEDFLIRTQSIQHVHPRSRTISVHLPNTAMTSISDSSDAFGTVMIQQDDRIAEVEPTLEDQPIPDQALSTDVLQEETIRLLEERLTVAYQRQKIGEVIVRKEVETEMIQVPVRREKLIVEQVSPDHRQLAEIDLGQSSDLSGLELIDHTRNTLTVTGDFSSPKTVAWLFDAIARQQNHGCKRIRITLDLSDAEHAELYQSWFDRSSDSRPNGR